MINCLPCKIVTKEIQALIALYVKALFFNSANTTVQAPHPPSAQPSLVPVFFIFNLIKFNKVSLGSGLSILKILLFQTNLIALEVI